jgi:hypothetical protein
VCISHATGGGGEEVGRLVAQRLGFFYVDEEIVARAAAKAGIDPREVADEERRKSRVARVLEAIAQGSGEAWALGVSGPPRIGDELRGDDMRALIRETIAQTAERGSMVIVAHAASHAVTRGPGRCASSHGSPRRVTGSSPREALDKPVPLGVGRFGRGPPRLPERFYDVDELPTQHDLVVNTDGSLSSRPPTWSRRPRQASAGFPSQRDSLRGMSLERTHVGSRVT